MAKKDSSKKEKIDKALDEQELKEETMRTGETVKKVGKTAVTMEEEAEKDAEISASKTAQAQSDQARDVAEVEAATGTKEEEPAEVAAIHEVGKNKKQRSKKYSTALDAHEPNKHHAIEEAVKRVKSLSYTKFDGTVELHVRLLAKKKSDDIALRGTTHLPSGSPKQRKIVIANDELIEEIAKGKVDFDILLATPADMPKLAKVAKVLGPKGKMPSPKSGTITEDPAKTKEELSGGLVEYKTDAHGNLHVAVGKVSWDDEKIVKNIEAMLNILPKKNIVSFSLAATMSPSVKIKTD